MQRLYIHIRTLLVAEKSSPVRKAGEALKELQMIDNAWLVTEDDRILDFGPMVEWENRKAVFRPEETTDCTGRIILPAFCDSHTHIVFAGSREGEFVDKINGLSYEEIARRGGGILNSAAKLRETSEEELTEQAWNRLEEMKRMGTGAVEIKSGYGLTVEDEIKMLKVIRNLKERSPLTIKSTFLGAHALPMEYRENRGAYIRLITEKMIPRIADEGLADYVDVFCDKGFFTPEETSAILECGARYGLKPKIHANELDYSGGIQTGVKYSAVSVDHLEFTGDEEIAALLASGTIPTLLPSTAFFLRLHYPPARKMISAGLPLALASDYNPGSSPSGNMFFVMSLACIQMKMLPEEVIHAATINGAYAMELNETHGSITPGKKANFIITEPVPSYTFLSYSFGRPHVSEIILNGEKQ